MKKWEYKTAKWSEIDELGNEGWELVAVIPVGLAGSTINTKCFFKREKK